MPGCTLVFEDGVISERRYWDVPSGQGAGDAGELSDGEAIERFRELLEESVRIRLMADVPLGMFLSGGLDSSAIAALMAKMIDRPLQTFWAFKQRRSLARLRAPGATGAQSDRTIRDRRRTSSSRCHSFWHETSRVRSVSVPLYFGSASPLHVQSSLS